MTSVKATMQCIGRDETRELSVLGDLFGFWRRRVPPDPEPMATASVSLRDQLVALEGPHIHLNVIQVGVRDSLTGNNRAAAREKVDYAIYRTRNIFAQVGLGVGRVNFHVIETKDADGLHDIGSEQDAVDLIDERSVGKGGLDCFVTRMISADFIGYAPEDSDGILAGAIDRGGAVTGGFEGFSRTFAHEIGHFLDLEHPHGKIKDETKDCPADKGTANNLMTQTRCATTTGDGERDSVLLTASQGRTMRGHSIVRTGCKRRVA